MTTIDTGERDDLNGLVESKQVPALPTFLDSPLAIKALPIYHRFPEYYDQEANELKASGDDFFKFPGLEVTKKPEESRGIIGVPAPMHVKMNEAVRRVERGEAKPSPELITGW